jgi:hypothetical protein
MIETLDNLQIVTEQKLENIRIEYAIKRQAREWFMEYDSAEDLCVGDIKFRNWMPLYKPLHLRVYDTATAKYKDSEEVKTAIYNEFSKLKDNADD